MAPPRGASHANGINRHKNDRLLRDTKITNIPRLRVLVGANGTGKSTLFDIFSILKDALTANVRKALAKRGTYKQIVSRNAFGSPIEITMQLRLEISGHERLGLLTSCKSNPTPQASPSLRVKFSGANEEPMGISPMTRS